MCKQHWKAHAYRHHFVSSSNCQRQLSFAQLDFTVLDRVEKIFTTVSERSLRTSYWTKCVGKGLRADVTPLHNPAVRKGQRWCPLQGLDSMKSSGSEQSGCCSYTCYSWGFWWLCNSLGGSEQQHIVSFGAYWIGWWMALFLCLVFIHISNDFLV